ncbi:MAG: ABC transporter permease [Thiotrichaceae bacterium]
MEPSSIAIKATTPEKKCTEQTTHDWNFLTWCQLGWYDFIFQHRRTVVGPLWQTLQMAIWASGLVIVFGSFHSNEPNYIPYVVSGLVVWGLLSSFLVTGTNIFTGNSALILNIPNPQTLYIVRSVSLITIRFGFQLLVFIPVAIYFQLPLDTHLLLVIPGILLILICFSSSMMILGVIGARLRDLEHLVAAAMRFLFFASPVFWIPEEGSLRSILTLINPLAWFLDIIRLPLLGEMPSSQIYISCTIVTLCSTVTAVFIQRRYGRFVPTWL